MINSFSGTNRLSLFNKPTLEDKVLPMESICDFQFRTLSICYPSSFILET